VMLLISANRAYRTRKEIVEEWRLERRQNVELSVFPGPGRSAVMNSATGAASTSELSGPMMLAKIGSSAAAKRLVVERKKLTLVAVIVLGPS
jgi:hypothetical protein